MIKILERRPILSILVATVVMLGFTADVIPVSIMEARNFISAREMLTDDHWILTTMNGEARYQKPPLPTWLTALFGALFGMTSVLALRWPALIFLALTSISVYSLSKRIGFSKAQSLINGFVALTSFYIIAITIEAPWDIYTHGFMILAIYMVFKIFRAQTFLLKEAFFFVVFIACSVLSKGPVSLYALFLPFLLAYGIVYKLPLKGGVFLKVISCLMVGLILGGAWYVYVRLEDPETFTKIATRETSNWSSYNVRPFYYYWSFFVQSGLWTIFALTSLAYPYLKHKVFNKQAYKFSFLWTILAVVLLSLIPEKKSRYLMPVLIPLALTIGFYLEYVMRAFKEKFSKSERLPVQIQFGIVAIIALCFWLSAFFIKDIASEKYLLRFIITSIIFFSIGLFVIISLKRQSIKTTFYLSILFMICLGFFGLPLIHSQKQIHYKSLSHLKSNPTPLYHVGYIAPEVIYDYGGKIPEVSINDDTMPYKASEFNLLTYDLDPEQLDLWSQNYHIEFVGTYDLNFSSKDRRGYKKRLVNQLYHLQRKRISE